MYKHYTYEEYLRINKITDEDRYGECDVCFGEGEHTCDCGDTHDCAVCGGEGKIDTEYDEYVRLCNEQEQKLKGWQ